MTLAHPTARTLALILAIALSGASPTAAQTVPGPNAVPVARAIALFDAVCGTTAKQKFRGAAKVMAANGIDVPSPHGTPTVYSDTEDLSFQVAKQGVSYTQCSMVFGTTEGVKTVMRALTDRFGPMSDMGGMTGTIDPKTGLPLIINPPTPNGGHTIFRIAYLAK